MMHIDFFVIFLNLVFIVGGIAVASLVLYWIIRSAVRAEFKRLYISDNTKEPTTQGGDGKE